ncbi:hypothetical protein [Streptomyces sp. FxanaA7]|uniref:hypothetical protein n=1 Tax=Streptomyces sp. FxanaA7 TaxID=1265492 RepID=UPI0005EDF480|nr:hypothetical protein [Streptomyces sp. FxanaA7]
MPSTSQTTAAPETQPTQFHWVMTVQTNDGRQATNDGRINAVPGVHTQETTYQAVRNAMKDLVGTDHFTVVFFALHPNQL